MSFDGITEAAARRLAGRHARTNMYTRRKALGVFAAAAAALGLGVSGLARRAAAASGTFTLVNQTGQTIWPGVAGNAIPNGGGFELMPGSSTTISLPANWSGRIWARTNCNFNGGGGCETGDCGGALACNGASGAANVTLAEFTLGAGGADFYDVSLVDAFNVPITITPQGGAGCATAGCSANLLPGCPGELQAVGSGGTVVACLSACTKFGGEQFCCTGPLLNTCNPATWPVNSAAYFKSGCPDAFSYAIDPVTSNFSCQGASGYVITFLPFGGSGGGTPVPVPSAPVPVPVPSAPPGPPRQRRGRPGRFGGGWHWQWW
jgi:hypothetical protein